MAEARIFTVRPLAKQVRGDLRESFRIYLSTASLAYLKLSPGNLCSLHVEGATEKKTAIAWNAVEPIKNTVIQASGTLQELYGIKLGDKLTITKVESAHNEAETVFVEECTTPEKLFKYGPLSDADLRHWEWTLEFPLLQCEIITIGLGFDVELKGQRRSFKVARISAPGVADQTISRFTERSVVKIGGDGGSETVEHPIAATLEVINSGLGGLSSQINKINQILVDFNTHGLSASMPDFYTLSRGILIYGPKGTGKTSLLQRIGSAGWKNTFTVRSSLLQTSSGDGEAQLRKIFKEASSSQPSAIIVDQIEFIAPKRTSAREASSLSHALCECIDSLGKDKVLVVAATRHPNDVDDALRTPHRLAVETEISVPTAAARREILYAIRGDSPEPNDSLIDLMAEKTHGYVGADLFALLQTSCRKARDRILDNGALVGSEPASDDTAQNSPFDLREDDILQAMQEIRPTAMREVFLETPKVRWTDIGGQKELKQHLKKVVERPLKFPERMQRLNVRSKKGVLLYGPPGCSKTLVAKALATEAGLNFLAVRGAEILNQYVGESERALREIFSKARAARPSIIFFDEIDAIAAKRSGSQGGVNVLTTLLNEMDGIEELRNVLVVAATNKPDVLDPALMRPGRLDNIVYVGPPDFEARKEIFSIWMKKSVIGPDVDVDELAINTEGYSGAEIISLCETAGEAALDDEDTTNEPQDIMQRHFDIASKRVKSQLTSELIMEYEEWSKLSAF